MGSSKHPSQATLAGHLHNVVGNKDIQHSLQEGADEGWATLVDATLSLEHLNIQAPADYWLANHAVAGVLGEVGPGCDPFADAPVMRHASEPHTSHAANPAALVSRARSTGGRPLPSDLRAEMEQQFGVDFSAVRIHTDTAASLASDGISARAFALGPDIFFNKSEFNPGSSQGRFLIAHELTHIVQSGLAPTNGPQAKEKAGNVTVSSPNDPHEREADAMAAAVLRGDASRSLPRLTGGGLPRSIAHRLAQAPAQSPTTIQAGSIDLLQSQNILDKLVRPQGTESDGSAPAPGQNFTVTLGNWGQGTLQVRQNGNNISGQGTVTINGGIFAHAPVQVRLNVSTDGQISGEGTLDPAQLSLGGLQADGQIAVRIGSGGLTANGTTQLRLGSILTGQVGISLVGNEPTLNGTLNLAEGLPFDGTGNVTVQMGSGELQLTGQVDATFGPLTGTLSPTHGDGGWSLQGELALQSTAGGRAGSGTIAVTLNQQGQLSGQGHLSWPINSNLTIEADATFDAGNRLVLNGTLDVGQALGVTGVNASGELTVRRDGALSGRLALSAESLAVGGFTAQSGRVEVVFSGEGIDLEGAIQLAYGTLATARMEASLQGDQISFMGNLKLDVLGSRFSPEEAEIRFANGQISVNADLGWTWNEHFSGSLHVAYQDGLTASGEAQLAWGENTGHVSAQMDSSGQFSGEGEVQLKPFPFLDVAGHVTVSPDGEITLDQVGARVQLDVPGVSGGVGITAQGRLDDESRFDGTVSADIGSFSFPGVTFTGSGIVLGVHGGELSVESAEVGVSTRLGDGQLSVAAQQDGLAFSTRVNLHVPRLQRAQLELTFAPNNVIEGSASVGTTFAGVTGNITVEARQDAGGELSLSGEGELGYEKGILKGNIHAALSQEGKWSGDGRLEARVTPDLTGEAEVEVDEEGKIRLGGEIALARGKTIFQGKSKELATPSFTASFPIFGFKIPFIDVGVGITADISAGINADFGFDGLTVNHASLRADVEELGETPPVFTLEGQAGVGAYAELGVFVEGALSAGFGLGSLSGFLRLNGNMEARADATVDLNASGSSMQDFSFDATAAINAGLRLSANVEAGVRARLGWGWASYTKEWSKQLAGWSYDPGINLDASAAISYSQAEGVGFDVEFDPPELDYQGIAENVAGRMM